jgi:hypothetical protein
MFSEMLMMEKKDACYYKVKASAKVWPSAYASGRLVQCRKKGAGNYGNKSEGVAEGYTDDDIETTKQFRNAITGLKAKSAIDKAKDGAGVKYYSDGAKVTPQETARRAAERKAEKDKKGVAEEYELAGVGVAYELGRRAYKERKTARDNPYSATREARKNDEWAKGLERGKHDANDARHFRSSVREQGVAEGLAQDEAEEDSGWRAEFVNEINYNTFEVKLTNTRSKESANFIVRPVDMVSYGPTLSIETMDVHDLQTGQTESWTNDDPAPEGPIAYAISGLFYDDKRLQQKLQNIIDTHDTKGQDMMPGLEKRRSIGQEVDADTYVDSGEKTQAAMAKMKKGVAEKLGDNRPKLGSKRDAGKSVRKWRSARGLDETGRTNEGGDVFMANIKDTPEYKAGFATGKLPVPHPEGTQQYASYYKGVIDKASPTLNKVGEGEQQKGADYRDPPEADYGDDYQDMVARVKKLAGLGPLKTVYDPAKRVYRNVPTAVQPKK